MKGSRMLMDMPYRYGGLFHDYSLDVEEWREIPKYRHHRRKTNHYDKCFCCGGEMLNSYSPSGELLKQNFPYLGEYRHERGREGGRCYFKIICRECAYAYGRGVIEMDGNVYHDPNEFSEQKYKKEKCGR